MPVPQPASALLGPGCWVCCGSREQGRGLSWQLPLPTWGSTSSMSFWAASMWVHLLPCALSFPCGQSRPGQARVTCTLVLFAPQQCPQVSKAWRSPGYAARLQHLPGGSTNSACFLPARLKIYPLGLLEISFFKRQDRKSKVCSSPCPSLVASRNRSVSSGLTATDGVHGNRWAMDWA